MIKAQNNCNDLIHVISLKNSFRRERICKQFKKIDVNFSFFDGVSVNDDNEVKSLYNDKKRIFYKGVSLTPTEICGFASHYLLWKKCIEKNHPIVILEDNASILEGFTNILNNLEKILEFDGLIKISKGHGSKYISIANVADNIEVVRFLSKTSSASGYILSPKIAKQLVENAVDWILPVDDYMDMEWLHSIKKYGLYPESVKRSRVASEIGNRDKPKIKLAVKLRRELLAIPLSIKKYLWFLGLRIKYRKNRKGQF